LETPSVAPPQRVGLRGLGRRWWLVLLAIAATAAAGYGAASLQTRYYRAESFVVVTSKPTKKDPGQAYDASRLALTYAASLPQDERLLKHIAANVGDSVDHVRHRFSVVNDTDTGFLRLRYRDKNADFAAAGARAAAAGVTARHPTASGVSGGTLQLVRQADVPKRRSNGRLFGAAIGAVLGLGLGLVLLLAWERADPRIDRSEDCLELTDVPTSIIDGITPAAGLTLLERWYELGRRSSVRVAILPLTGDLEDLADGVARWFGGHHSDPAAAPTRFRRSGTDQPTQEMGDGQAHNSLSLVSGAPTGGPSAGEMEALRSDVVVLVVHRGAKARRLVSAVEVLEQFGHSVDWILFVNSPRTARKRFSGEGAGFPPAGIEQETASPTTS
jgi:capsular polysaccharide biosynthesis protein